MEEKIFFAECKKIQASDKLHKRIAGLSYALPATKETHVPLFAFKLAMVLGVVVLVFLGTTGFVAAANLSKPGSVLYPVKQALEKSHVPFISTTITEKEITPTPTPVIHTEQESEDTPKPTVPHIKRDDARDENEIEIETDVKGIQNTLRNNKREHEDNTKEEEHKESDKHDESEIEQSQNLHIAF